MVEPKRIKSSPSEAETEAFFASIGCDASSSPAERADRWHRRHAERVSEWHQDGHKFHSGTDADGVFHMMFLKRNGAGRAYVLDVSCDTAEVSFDPIRTTQIELDRFFAERARLAPNDEYEKLVKLIGTLI